MNIVPSTEATHTSITNTKLLELHTLGLPLGLSELAAIYIYYMFWKIQIFINHANVSDKWIKKYMTPHCTCCKMINSRKKKKKISVNYSRATMLHFRKFSMLSEFYFTGSAQCWQTLLCVAASRHSCHAYYQCMYHVHAYHALTHIYTVHMALHGPPCVKCRQSIIIMSRLEHVDNISPKLVCSFSFRL